MKWYWGVRIVVGFRRRVVMMIDFAWRRTVKHKRSASGLPKFVVRSKGRMTHSVTRGHDRSCSWHVQTETGQPSHNATSTVWIKGLLHLDVSSHNPTTTSTALLSLQWITRAHNPVIQRYDQHKQLNNVTTARNNWNFRSNMQDYTSTSTRQKPGWNDPERKERNTSDSQTASQTNEAIWSRDARARSGTTGHWAEIEELGSENGNEFERPINTTPVKNKKHYLPWWIFFIVCLRSYNGGTTSSHFE